MNMTSRRWRPLFLTLVLVSCVGCDQATKEYAVQNFKGQPPLSYFGDTFRIQYAENPGAFLGLMGDLPRHIRMWILTIANGGIMVVVAIYLLVTREIDMSSLFALSLIVAGGIGNLIDRVTQDGVVIDFLVLDSGIGPLRTGVFNVADMAITGGFFLLLPQLFRGDAKECDRESPHPEPAT